MFTSALTKSSSHPTSQEKIPSVAVDITYAKTSSPPLSSLRATCRTIKNALSEIYEGIPLLPLPQLDYNSLFHLLEKAGIASANHSHQGLRQEIDTLDRDIAKTHQEMLAEKKAARKAENAAKPWSAMTKMMSWMAALMAIFTGCVLIATGAGALAGAMCIVGGVLSTANHILEVSGAWTKIGAKMDDETKKSRSIVMWIQISIAVLSMVLMAIGGIFGGGLSAMKGAMGTAGIFGNAITSASMGMLLLGKGVVDKKYHLRMARYKELEKLLITLNKLEREMLIKDLADQADYAQQLLEQGNRVRKMRIADDRAMNMINMR